MLAHKKQNPLPRTRGFWHTVVMNDAGTTAKHRRLIIAGLISLILVAGAVWFMRPAYRRYKEQRCLRLAQQFFTAGDYRNGLLSLRQTLALNPKNLPAVRLMADFATQTHSPAGLAWWRRVVELAPTAEHRCLLAAAALRLEPPPFPVAATALEELAATGVTNLEYQLLASQLALKLNRGDVAEAHLAAAVQLQPTNLMHHVNLATLRLQSRNPAVAAAARDELVRNISNPVWGPVALRSLVADALNHSNASAALKFSSQLQAATNAPFADRLQHLNVLAVGQATALDEELNQFQQSCGTNALEIAQLALWMQGHQRAKAAQNWLARLPPKLRELPAIALVEAECFMAARDWNGLEARLAERKWDDQEYLRYAYLARGLRELGRSATASANWERAVGAAANRSEPAGALAQLAFNWGWREEGLALLWQLTRRAGAEEWPLQNLLRYYSATDDTPGMQRVHQELWRRHPEALPVKNNFAMLCLLLNTNTAQAFQLAQEVYQASPTNGIYASTHALALHFQKRTDEGLRILNQLPAAERSRAEVVPYHALLRAGAGELEAAREMVAQAPKHPLLPEERALFRSLAD